MQWLLFLTLLAFTISFSSAIGPVRKRTMTLVRTARSSPEEHYSCVTRPCKNGATCFEIEKGQGGYFCACSDSYRGINCETEMKSCEDIKCDYYHGCVHSSKFRAVCICNKGSALLRCFHKMEGKTQGSQKCPHKPCENGGKCAHLNEGTKHETRMCACPRNTGGFQCETDYLLPALMGVPRECTMTADGPTCVTEVPATRWSKPKPHKKFIYTGSNAVPESSARQNGLTSIPDKKQTNDVLTSHPGKEQTNDGLTSLSGKEQTNDAGASTVKGSERQKEISSLFDKEETKVTTTSCKPNPCENNGTCHKNPLKGSESILCACPLQHRGFFCEKSEADRCAALVCRRFEDCTYTAGGSFCLCEDVFLSKVCDFGIIPSFKEEIQMVAQQVSEAKIALEWIAILPLVLMLFLCCLCFRSNKKAKELRNIYEEIVKMGGIPADPPLDTLDVFYKKLGSAFCCKTSSIKPFSKLIQDSEDLHDLSKAQSQVIKKSQSQYQKASNIGVVPIKSKTSANYVLDGRESALRPSSQRIHFGIDESKSRTAGGSFLDVPGINMGQRSSSMLHPANSIVESKSRTAGASLQGLSGINMGQRSRSMNAKTPESIDSESSSQSSSGTSTSVTERDEELQDDQFSEGNEKPYNLRSVTMVHPRAADSAIYRNVQATERFRNEGQEDPGSIQRIKSFYQNPERGGAAFSFNSAAGFRHSQSNIPSVDDSYENSSGVALNDPADSAVSINHVGNRSESSRRLNSTASFRPSQSNIPTVYEAHNRSSANSLRSAANSAASINRLGSILKSARSLNSAAGFRNSQSSIPSVNDFHQQSSEIAINDASKSDVSNNQDDSKFESSRRLNSTASFRHSRPNIPCERKKSQSLEDLVKRRIVSTTSKDSELSIKLSRLGKSYQSLRGGASRSRFSTEKDSREALNDENVSNSNSPTRDSSLVTHWKGNLLKVPRNNRRPTPPPSPFPFTPPSKFQSPMHHSKFGQSQDRFPQHQNQCDWEKHGHQDSVSHLDQSQNNPANQDHEYIIQDQQPYGQNLYPNVPNRNSSLSHQRSSLSYQHHQYSPNLGQLYVQPTHAHTQLGHAVHFIVQSPSSIHPSSSHFSSSLQHQYQSRRPPENVQNPSSPTRQDSPLGSSQHLQDYRERIHESKHLKSDNGVIYSEYGSPDHTYVIRSSGERVETISSREEVLETKQAEFAKLNRREDDMFERRKQRLSHQTHKGQDFGKNNSCLSPIEEVLSPKEI